MMPCPLCKTLQALPKRRKGGFLYRWCPACDVLYLDHPGRFEPAAVYGPDYFAWVEHAPTGARTIKRHTFERVLRVVERSVRPGPLLDVGCSYGFMLEEARDRGWDPYGVEISDHTRAFAAATVGAQRVFTTLAEIQPASLRFSAITLMDSVEHFYDPDALLTQLSPLLAPDGVMALTTPDIASGVARVMGDAWFHLKPDEHPVLYSARSLCRLLDKHGFETFACRRAVKIMDVRYVVSQFERYDFPLKAWISGAGRRLPAKLLAQTFPVYSGEMFLLARRWTSTDAGKAVSAARTFSTTKPF